MKRMLLLKREIDYRISRINKELMNGQPEKKESKMQWEEWLIQSLKNQMLPKKNLKEELFNMQLNWTRKRKKKKKIGLIKQEDEIKRLKLL